MESSQTSIQKLLIKITWGLAVLIYNKGIIGNFMFD
jgi:hypothetical protein